MRILSLLASYLVKASIVIFLCESRALLLAGEVSSSVPSCTFRIDNTTKIKDIFECSRIHFIGSFNEYYVACDLKLPTQPDIALLEIVNVTLDGSVLSPHNGVHVELIIQLNTSLATVSIRNSQVQASAVHIRAANVSIDEHSSVNVTARGLKFGPGYNSWTSMGGSYGGIGGVSLTSNYQDCDDVSPNDFFRAVGDVSANPANFRGYGSGGGNADSRGGGLIRLIADINMEINGSLLANGGNACVDCYDSAGAGGSIILIAKNRIDGNATVQANGGRPSQFNRDELTGGGGGGGGGRIVLDSMDAEESGPTQIEAYGGGFITNDDAPIKWCQLGGDGTILKRQHSTKDDSGPYTYDESDLRRDDIEALVSTLLVSGGRLTQAEPVKRVQLYGCTPIFEQTSRGASFLPKSLAHIFVSGGASVCAANIQLKLESGSELNALDSEKMIFLSASQITLQAYLGPSSFRKHELFDLILAGGDVTFSNAFVMVHELKVNAYGTVSLDKFSEIKFQSQVYIKSEASAKIKGFIQPLSKIGWTRFDVSSDNVPFINVISAKDIELYPQAVELGQINLRVQAKGSVIVDMPFNTPFLKLSISAANVTIHNVNSGPVLDCKEIELQGNASACKIVQDSAFQNMPYLISVHSSGIAKIGNISSGSIMLCCSSTMIIEGAVSGSWLGCGSGIGPGKSDISGEASGGAGHGGRGGNVLPGGTGGGIEYDISSDILVQQSNSLIKPWYEEKSWPTWPGSGAASGDKFSGGSGGGIIFIGSKVLNLTKVASISARGRDGTLGGGGGSGGSLTLFIENIVGGGNISLMGGSATTPAMTFTNGEAAIRPLIWNPEWVPFEFGDVIGKLGGGGGGGVVRITYVNTTDEESAGNGEEFNKDGGCISVDGGESTDGENGGSGVMIGSNCHPGRGGVLCLSCPGGSYSPGRFSKCLPCDPGTNSDHIGAEKCDACPRGHFNLEFGMTECQACPLGSFSAKEGSIKCALCPPGSFAGVKGSEACSLCPSGSITVSSGNINCTLCGIGETTSKAGATECHSCRNKPEHSEFNLRGNCSYACSKGRNGLDCKTPFERLMKPIGGPIGFAILLLTITGLILGSWGYISVRSSRSELHRYAHYKAQRLRDELSLATLTRTLTPRLIGQDLKNHVARLYFAGDNHLKNAWRLNPYFLPSNLREIIEEETFAEFASTCNKLVEWNPSNWEGWLYFLLFVTVPPISTLFVRKRQLHRVKSLSKYIVQYGGRFFRDMNFRVHGTQLKLGFSSDFSLGYLDVMISQSRSSLSLNLITFQAVSTENHVLVASGSGSFFRPYHLDSNDIVVRAIPSRLELLEHNFWIDFVADINEKLRVLPQPSSTVRRVREASTVSLDIIKFVNAFNEKHVKDGFAVRFGTFSVGGAIAANSNNSCFESITLENVDAIFASYPQNPFKLALKVEKLDLLKSISATIGESLASGSDNCVVHLEEYDRHKAESDPRSADFRYSKIRLEALFAQPKRRSIENNAVDSSDGNDSLTLLKNPVNNSVAWRAGAFVSHLWTNDTAKRWLSAILLPMYPLFRLRNTPRPKLSVRRLLPVVMVLLIIVDMGVVFWIMVEFNCVQIRDPTAQDSGCSRTALWSVVGILPAAIAGSPVFGLIFITRKNIFYGKLFAVWNASSIVNLGAAFICGLLFVTYIHDDILLVAVGGVLVKYLEKEVALRCIALYASERVFRGWRGLHSTCDWYDAAYTPLVHYEG
ncbi:hypothetical protein CCR75_000748 [Bremia lactucae]|uniref:Tyrosine-protein kinase ephrin type A/B receptor-like domain-containing protein n=1 Tax=Bremia lactucae TaxID=4779 RepID=A0A976IJ35_BRELC|nr:hypothetical protein CCR75_000748 [Bremia lactucae]